MNDKPDALAIRPVLNEQGRANTPGEPALPRRFSDALAVAIIKCILDTGAYPEVAAEACGLPRNEYYAWKRMVEQNQAHPKVVELFDAMGRGEATYMVQLLTDISKEMSVADRIKMLERRFAKHYSQQLNVKHDYEQNLNTLIERLEGLRRVDRMMSGEEAHSEALKLIGGG